jgi:hypothetical protein
LLFLKPLKCIIEQEEVDFLGVQLSHGYATIELSKVAGIKDWPEELHNIKQIRQVLSVLGFQQLFIPDFATIV